MDGRFYHISSTWIDLFWDKRAFSLFTLSGAKKLDNRKVKRVLGRNWLRFAHETELFEMTGVVKGALPPFGRPILPYQLYLDRSVLG